MVWASQEPTDDFTSGIECVRAKPLKKRCCPRAGLSRYYSSKSQSFSSLDRVHCTPFGVSALALAKRPSSFDLRRAPPRPSDHQHQRVRPNTFGMGSAREEEEEETSMSFAYEDDDERDEPTSCPCNDTIFANPGDAFMSPEGSPSVSLLHDSCNSSDISALQSQQPRQFQLTAEYLSQLSALLPLSTSAALGGCGDYSSAAGGSSGVGILSAGLSGSCCSSGSIPPFHMTLSGSSSSSGSACASHRESTHAVSAALTRQIPDRTQATLSYTAREMGTASSANGLNGGANRGFYPAASCNDGTSSERLWQQHAISTLTPGIEPAARQTLLPESCGGFIDLRVSGVGSAYSPAGNGYGGGGTRGIGQTSGVGSCSRNFLSTGGYPGPLAALNVSASAAHSSSLSSAPAREASCAGSGSCGSFTLGRKLALAHRRLRAAQTAGLVAVQSARHAAAGLFGSTEDLMSSLTLSERRPQCQRQQLHPHENAGVFSNEEGRFAGAEMDLRWQQPLQLLPEQGPISFRLSSVERQGLVCTSVTHLDSSATVAAGRYNEGTSPVGIAHPSGAGYRQQRQQLQLQQQWLCSSAPPASCGLGTFGGGNCY